MGEQNYPHVYIKHVKERPLIYFKRSATSNEIIVHFKFGKKNINNSVAKLYFDEWLLYSQTLDHIKMEQRDDGSYYQVDEYVLENKKYRLVEPANPL